MVLASRVVGKVPIRESFAPESVISISAGETPYAVPDVDFPPPPARAAIVSAMYLQASAASGEEQLAQYSFAIFAHAKRSSAIATRTSLSII